VNVPRIAFILLVIIGIAQAGFFAPRLPARVASHFDATGRADAWSSKESLLSVHVAMVGLLSGIFLILPLFLPRIPPSLINLPGKDYWLAPGRRAETLARFGRQLTAFGCAAMVFLLVIMHIVFEANIHGWSRIPEKAVLALVAGFLAVVIAFTVTMLVRWRAPRPERAPSPGEEPYRRDDSDGTTSAERFSP
jgi:uncharacterized membrane protein